jgi:hypothetical protein
MHWYDMIAAYLGPIFGILALAAHNKITTIKNPALNAVAQIAAGSLAAYAPVIEQKAANVSPVLGALAGEVIGGITQGGQAAPSNLAATTPTTPTAQVGDNLPPVIRRS